ncbi:hypothetical protein SAMD00019534_012390 [Acytostelium subglobosum LB1]|uniref:hypothetical protein n=1 Tax=Acytostelium subglobosum LB1 TaxID=1410327 RepID=UPI000644CEC9|nr:hypothetical protein SAMD00019534_012390 [Acytostelium subglobosum LB1]GAM18064.1 hypothetical protein SAMD00019534_012390 [Acytostelium subglobosum LB1]|eukprot:XP_012758660.1 hypothetical protein SAMD00019534_012390 [Acytostelium subglobosum LB1]
MFRHQVALLALFSIVASALLADARVFRPHVDLHRHTRVGHQDAHLQGIKYQWFTQRLDHFNQANQGTFQQRYVINDQYWDGTGPVFMMINGEGPMDLGTVTGMKFVQWAETFKALIISLEHRYYGASFATPDLSTENLAYLSSQQALGDNAVFRQFIAAEYNVPASSKWVSFGGSYSGALTSWFRLKYPALVDLTIASSAPVNAVVDFYQYLEVVQNSLLATTNGQQCVNNIAAATQKIQGMLQQQGGLQSVSNMFKLVPALQTQNDVANFMQSLAGNFMGVVQYNLEGPGPSTTSLCQTMTNNANDALTNYLAVWNTFADNESSDVTYQTMIEEMLNVTNDENAIGGRMWFYQTCTEFGYYQTSDSSNQPFGDLFPIQFATQQCDDVFNFTFLPNVNWTHTTYGDLNPVNSNILYVNGDIDPWHSLGIYTNPTTSPSPSLLIHGTAHCADMMIPNSYSPSTLVPAQKTIESYLQKWLQ